MKTIQTAEAYEQALERVKTLMDCDPIIGTPESNELNSLVDKIIEYEDKHFPFDED